MASVFSSTKTARLTSALGTTNATLVLAGERSVHSVVGYNSVAAVKYLKLYDKATAPTVGTDVPVMTIALPPSTAFGLTLGGHVFKQGLAYALTGVDTDADTTALTAGDIKGLNILYT